jgi:hypothetical protein
VSDGIQANNSLQRSFKASASYLQRRTDIFHRCVSTTLSYLRKRDVLTDGVSFLANLIATVFMLLNLNAVMSIIFNVPAAVSSTIVASRAVRRLADYGNSTAEVYTDGYTTRKRKNGSNRIIRRPQVPFFLFFPKSFVGCSSSIASGLQESSFHRDNAVASLVHEDATERRPL